MCPSIRHVWTTQWIVYSSFLDAVLVRGLLVVTPPTSKIKQHTHMPSLVILTTAFPEISSPRPRAAQLGLFSLPSWHLIQNWVFWLPEWEGMGRKLTLMDCLHSVGYDITYFLQLLMYLKLEVICNCVWLGRTSSGDEDILSCHEDVHYVGYRYLPKVQS